jgi:SAM-dependent methyltransferase
LQAGTLVGHERVLQALARHLSDLHGFRGLRLETRTASGRIVAYRVLPPPYPAQDKTRPQSLETANKLRLIPLGPGGHPETVGARLLTPGEVMAALSEALGQAEGGWAASATRTSGLDISFGAAGIKMAFRRPATVASRIPIDEPRVAPQRGGEPATQAARECGRNPAGPTSPARTGGSRPDLHQELGEAVDLSPVSDAAPLLSALGLLSPGGQVRRDERRKHRQIVHFLHLIDRLVRKLPEGREALVVDCGCGKSQLLFVLNYWLTERLGRRAFFVGLDTAPSAIETARRLQAKLGYRNMDFAVGAIAGWKAPAAPDLVLSLHACDTATDEAIALGIRAGSTGIIAVPCCQHEIADQVTHAVLRPVFAHPVLLDRFGDWLTDSLRVLALEACGYRVDTVEYVSPLDTPKNIMLRAEKNSRADRRAYERYCGVRDLFGAMPALDRLLAGIWPASG